MKKIICIAIIALGLGSCTYDYNMPDYSNLHSSYRISPQSSYDVSQSWVHALEEQGISFSYDRVDNDYVVCELSEKGNTLYQGKARSKTETNTKSLKVGVCYSYKEGSWPSFYDAHVFCTFWLDKTFEIEVSPNTYEIEITDNEPYSVVLGPKQERKHKYSLEVDDNLYQLIQTTADGIGYVFDPPLNATIVEKDADGNILYNGKPHEDSMMGSETIEVKIDFYGYPKGTTNYPMPIGAINFPPITLEGNRTIVLSSDMDYELELIPEEKRSIPYYVDTDVDANLTNLITSTIESLGYQADGNRVVLVEKNKDGKILATKTIDNATDLQNSAIGAETLEISIEFAAGTIKFSPMKLEVNKRYSLTSEMDSVLETKSVGYSVGYDNSVSGGPITDLLELVGYQISGTEIAVTECDLDGNALITKKLSRNTYDTQSSVVNARSIIVSIDIYGWPKGTYINKTKVGAITFGPLNLEVNKKYVLTSKMDYTIENYISN